MHLIALELFDITQNNFRELVQSLCYVLQLLPKQVVL